MNFPFKYRIPLISRISSMAPNLCTRCGEGEVVWDVGISSHVCVACGNVNASDYFCADPTDNSFVFADFTYDERKRYNADKEIKQITSTLGLSPNLSAETLTLVADLTSHSFGAGEWLRVLASAAAYVVCRRHRLPISLHEAAAASSSDHRQISRMVLRILSHLELPQLPGFDAVAAFNRAVRECPSFTKVDDAKKEELIADGSFLMQCMTKWFLMTGRRPLPAVAAVAVFVAEVKGVAVQVEEVAKELNASVHTSRVRLRELKETLIKAARALLPWGKDVNLKNLVHNMPLLIRVMDVKARSKKKEMEAEEMLDFNLDGYLTLYPNADQEDDSDYFKISSQGVASCGDVEGAGISGERLLNVYKNALDQLANFRDAGGLKGEQVGRKRMSSDFDIDDWDTSWELTSKTKLTLEQMLDRDVGYDALPPSFVSNLESREMRKLKITAAKQRINQIVDPFFELVEEEDERPVKDRKRRKRKAKKVDGIDWEDCIIELLLLHQANEAEIEEGQYRRLLDLHVFC